MGKEKAYLKNYRLEKLVVLENESYLAYIAPFAGSDVARLYDKKRKIDVFNYFLDYPFADLKKYSLVCGIPTLFLPNRLKDGILKTSEDIYHFPINEEKNNNFIHGFLHEREHKLVNYGTDNGCSFAITKYEYNNRDSFYKYFPLDFTAEFKFTLSSEGFHYEFCVTNKSNKMLPFGTCTHTSINAKPDKERSEVKFCIPVINKIQLDNRKIPTGEFLELNEDSKKYLLGEIVANREPIDDEVFNFGDLNGFHGALIKNKKNNFTIKNETSEDYLYYILWNADGKAGFTCLEPSTWIINAPNIDLEKEISGYIELTPGESKTVWQHFSVEDM